MAFNQQIQDRINHLGKAAGAGALTKGAKDNTGGALDQLAALLKELIARVEALEEQAHAAKFAPGGRLRK